MAEEKKEGEAAETPKPTRRVKKVLREAPPEPETKEARPVEVKAAAPPERKPAVAQAKPPARPARKPAVAPARKEAKAAPVVEAPKGKEVPAPKRAAKPAAKKPVPKRPETPKPAEREVPEAIPEEIPEKAPEKPAEKKARKVAKPAPKKAEKEEKGKEAEEGEEEEEEHVARSKPELPDAVRNALRVRRQIASRRPTFYRQEWFRYPRLGLKWRKPQGGQSKLRRHYGYRINVVSIGFRGPRVTRGLHPSGFEEVLIHTVRDLKSIDPKRQAARIGGTVGGRRRAEIQKEAEELGVRILNRREE
jgi:large subunit ribosomal protein L32e